jgi:hypothetical protein
MPYFKTKPAIVQAERWFPGMTVPGLKEQEEGFCILETTQGAYMLRPGDWIVTDAQGERSVCLHEAFIVSYEPSDAEAEAYFIKEVGHD